MAYHCLARVSSIQSANSFEGEPNEPEVWEIVSVFLSWSTWIHQPPKVLRSLTGSRASCQVEP